MTEPVTGAHDVAGLLASWLPRQRWFAAGPSGVTLAPAGRIILAAPTGPPFPPPAESDLPAEPPVGIAVHIVSALPAGSVPETDGSAAKPVARKANSATYQVPLTYRTEPVPELAHALVGELRTADGPRWVYDAPHDPVFVAEWIRLV